jgi:hypothetical protein
MDPDDDIRAPGLSPRSSAYSGAHDRCGVFLSVVEQRRFNEIVAPMWTLRLTRGRRASIFGRARTCSLFGIVGILFSIVALGTLPVVASFAGFVLALVTFQESSRHVGDTRWWRRTRRSVGLEGGRDSGPR